MGCPQGPESIAAALGPSPPPSRKQFQQCRMGHSSELEGFKENWREKVPGLTLQEPVSEREFKTAMEKCPSCLLGVPPLHFEGTTGSFCRSTLRMVGQPVSPLLQGKHHCEQLSFPNIIIYLNCHQLSTIEGTRI